MRLLFFSELKPQPLRPDITTVTDLINIKIFNNVWSNKRNGLSAHRNSAGVRGVKFGYGNYFSQPIYIHTSLSKKLLSIMDKDGKNVKDEVKARIKRDILSPLNFPTCANIDIFKGCFTIRIRVIVLLRNYFSNRKICGNKM